MRVFRKDDLYRRLQRGPEELLHIEVDFCFFSKEQEKVIISCLVLVDCDSGATAASASPTAVGESSVSYAEATISGLGRMDIALLINQEPSIELLPQGAAHRCSHRAIVRASLCRGRPQGEGGKSDHGHA